MFYRVKLKDIIVVLLSKSPTEVCIENIFQCLFASKESQKFAVNPELRLNIVCNSNKSQNKNSKTLVSDKHTESILEVNSKILNKNAQRNTIKTVLVSNIHTESKIDSLIDVMKADVMTSLRGDFFVSLLEQMVKVVSLGVTKRSSTENYDTGKI